MKFQKIKFSSKCYAVAVTDDDDNVITAGAFENQNDADSAVNIAYTLAVRCGLVEDKNYGEAPQMKLETLLALMEAQAK